MAASGIGVHNDVLTAYQNFSQKKDLGNGQKYSFVVARISEDHKSIVFDQGGKTDIGKDSKSEQENFQSVIFPEFVKKIVSFKDPCFAIIDVFYSTPDGTPTSKILIMRWTPDATTTVKLKMVYSSAEGNFKSKLNASKIYQANDASALTLQSIIGYIAK